MLQSFLVLKPKASFSEVTSVISKTVAHTLGLGLEHSSYMLTNSAQSPQRLRRHRIPKVTSLRLKRYPIFWATHRKLSLHFMWDRASCNFILSSEASEAVILDLAGFQWGLTF